MRTSSYLRLDDLESSIATTSVPTVRSAPSEESATDDLSASKRHQKKHKPGWRLLFAFTAKRHIPVLVFSILSSVAAGGIAPVMSIFLGNIFRSFGSYTNGEIDGKQFKSNISRDCVCLTALGVLTMALNQAFFTLWLSFGELQANNCRLMLFEGLEKRPAKFYDQTNIKALLPRIQARIRELQLSVSQPLGTTVQKLFTAVTAIAIALYYNWRVTLIMTASLPVAALLLSWISSRLQESIRQHQNMLSKATICSTAALSAMSTVKCFNGKGFEAIRYAGAIDRAGKSYMNLAHLSALQLGFVTFVTLGVFCQGFWYGSSLVFSTSVHSRAKTTGDIIAAFWAFLTAMQALEEITPQLTLLEKGKAAGENLRAVPFHSESTAEHSGGVVPPSCTGRIRFKNVSFSYPTAPMKLVLSNFNMAFAPGEITFIVGKSGCGKSTLGQLLLNFYQPSSGQIFLDGMELFEINSTWLRREITLVEQDAMLFQSTLSENISLGRSHDDSVNLTKVKSAAEFALLQEFILDRLDGLDGAVGRGGNNLSGGQKQRIALARARVRDSPVLMLDESTSALDPVSKSLMAAAIRSWRGSRDKTTLIITHDIEMIKPRDFVCIMEQGRATAYNRRHVLEEQGGQNLTQFFSSQAETTQLGDDRTTSLPVHVQRQRSCRLQKYIENSTYERALPPVSPRFIQRSEGLWSSPSPLNSPLNPFRTSFYGVSVYTRQMVATDESQSSRSDVYPLNNTPDPSAADIELQVVKASGMTAAHRRHRIATPSSRGTDNNGYGENESIVAAEKVIDGQACRRQRIRTARAASMRSILHEVWRSLTLKSRVVLIAAFVAATLHSVATPAFSFVFMKLLNTLLQDPSDSHSALKWLLALLGLSVFDGLCSYSFFFLLDYSCQKGIDAIRKRAMRRILSQAMTWFDSQSNSPGYLSHILDRDGEEMRNLGRFAIYVYIATLMTIVAVTWSLITCWKLSMVGISITPLCYGTTKAFAWISSRMEALSNATATEAAEVVEEVFSSIKTVRALTAEQHFRNKHTSAARKVLRAGIKKSLYSGLAFSFSEAIIILISALLFYYGAVLTVTEDCSVEEILLVFGLLLFSLANLGATIDFIPQIEAVRDSASRLLSLTSLPNASHEDSGKTKISTVDKIEFSNLSFSYGNDLVLSNVTLELRPGITAVVGPSGSGKSTIPALLLRLYEVEDFDRRKDGQIKFNGQDIKQLDTRALRQLISLVPQSPPLFPLSIAENISYGLPQDSPYNGFSYIQDAAGAAGVHDFIASLPRGYDTPIGEGGVGISGGQAQRLMIARALLRKPEVLILDEATSALDTASSAAFRNTIRKLVEQRPRMTVLIISHAVDMMKVADRIVMLDQGRVVEEGGTFEHMMALRGRFAEFVSCGQWMG